MGSNKTERITNSEPFSIREYVLSVRQKDIHHNWPFPEKYLQLCLNHGIKRVLPPFQHSDSVRHPSCQEHMGSICSEEINVHKDSVDKSMLGINGEQQVMEDGIEGSIDKEILDFSKKMCLLSLSENPFEHGEVDPNSDILINPKVATVHPSTTEINLNNHINQNLALLPPYKGIKRKRKRRKGKPKKRSMMDIFAEAKPCTLEDQERNVVGLNLGANLSTKVDDCNLNSIRTEDFGDEGNAYTKNEQGCQYDSMKSVSDKKHSRDEITSTDSPLSKKRKIIKLKLSVCKSKSRNSKLNLLTTPKNKVPETLTRKSLKNDGSTSILKVHQSCQGQRKDNPEISGALSNKGSNKSKEHLDFETMKYTTTHTKCSKDLNVSNPTQHLPIISSENSKSKGRKQQSVRIKRCTISTDTCPVHSSSIP